eukprot:gnl/TRDRNA2_/TRDRNA2_32444_c0_seq1.p1 gnl/TRDRNA2_/TRDRNA2_32444_c0~~gnl/TRDRNA2_/TRDRNA2_32444_c0_seq1.p1  ORF type:complete len:253 (+),score=19.94 gnl/TRDRNA2_/TRDRNA2_32444_c0_seq1:1-759(+)
MGSSSSTCYEGVFRKGRNVSTDTLGMTLADGWSSSCAWRVRIIIELKGIKVARRYVFPWTDNTFNDGLKRPPAGPHLSMNEATAINPMREVPWLEMRSSTGEPLVVTQSCAIAELLEEMCPDPPLLPSDSWRRAGVREMMQIVNSGIQPLQKDTERHERGLRALELLTERNGGEGPYMTGNLITLADAYVIPALANARFFGVNVSPYPRLLALEAACAKHPAFISAAPERQPDCPALGDGDFQKRYPGRVLT